MDINSQIAKFLQGTGNTEYDAKEINDTLRDLAFDVWESNSIFVYDDSTSKEELIEYMSKAAGKDDAQFKKDVELLFNILNAGSDDDVLTSDELKILTNSSGDNKDKIDGFGIWNQLLNTKEENIQSEQAKLQLDSKAEEIATSDDAEKQLAIYAIAYGEDSEEYKALKAKIEEQSGTGEDSKKDGLSSEKITDFANQIIAGNMTIEEIISSGVCSDADIEAIRSEVDRLQTGESGDSDVVEEESGNVVEEDAEAEPVSTEVTIPADKAEVYAQELMSGLMYSNTGKINEYLDISSANLVEVMSQFTDEGMSFTKMVEAGFGNSSIPKAEREAIINKVMSAAIEQAEAGNEDAIKFLCNELYQATAATWGYSGFMVLDSFFSENTPNSVIRAVEENYSTHVKGHELRDDINGEAMIVHQKEKAHYLASIDNSWSGDGDSIPDDKVEDYTQELLNGLMLSDSNKINEYLDLSSGDIVKVMSKFADEGMSFTKMVEAGFGGNNISKADKKAIIDKVMSAAIAEAEAGNEDAVKFLCNELYQATAATWGYSGFITLDSFFGEGTSNSVIRAVEESYSTYVKGRDLRDDINGEGMYAHQKEKAHYLASIDKSWEEDEF